jgi:hypothetical protein
LRELGYEVAKTEHWNHYAKKRQDLYGFIDTLAVKEGEEMLAIQTTDGAHLSEHRTKIRRLPIARLLGVYMRIEIWSWSLGLTRKRRADGLLNRKKEWLLKRVRIR